MYEAKYSEFGFAKNRFEALKFTWTSPPIEITHCQLLNVSYTIQWLRNHQMKIIPIQFQKGLESGLDKASVKEQWFTFLTRSEFAL